MRSWILKELCEDRCIEAIERNIIEHQVFFASRHPQMEVVACEDFVLVDTKSASRFFNYVYIRKSTLDDAEPSMETMLEYFKLQNRPFSWVIGPTVSTEVFKPVLEALGFKRQEPSYCMVMNLHHLNKRLKYIPGFYVQQALTREVIQDVGKVYETLCQEKEAVSEYFTKVSTLALRSCDPMRLFVGYLHDEPCVVGELYLGAGIAGLRCSIAYKWKSQEKEMLLDLMIKMLAQAKQQGYHIAMVKTFKEHCSYLQQLGFKRYCEVSWYQT
ncbi:MAG: hypothetical protein FJZ63_06140 [Chlamydiae bacterium]|nr:hypothetical protein [Chlamydiota bacterium]